MLSGGSCRYRKFLDSPTAMVSTALLIRLAVFCLYGCFSLPQQLGV